MNELSMYLILADILGGVGKMFLVPSIIALLILTVGPLIISLGLSADRREPFEDVFSEIREKLLPKKWIYGLLLVTMLIGSMTPTKETLYLVAASELSETIVQNETSQRIVEKIENYLDVLLEKNEK